MSDDDATNEGRLIPAGWLAGIIGELTGAPPDAVCANGDHQPIAGSVTTDVVDVAVDEDGYCWVTVLVCADCLAKGTSP